MASNQPKRRTRGLMIAVAVSAVVVSVPSWAAASPAPSTTNPPPPTMPTGTPLQQYEQLSEQANVLSQQLLTAQSQQGADQAKLDQANAGLASAQRAEAAAQAQENGLRGQIDQLADAQYQGVRFGQLSALLTGSSAQDYLDKASLMQDLAETSASALDKMQAATDAATKARDQAASDQQTAQNATNAANALVTQIQQKQAALQPLINKAEAARASIDPSALRGSIDPSQFMIPAGAAGAAIRAAEAELGKPYQWGGNGPDSFDCSGLMVWAWKAAGVSLPRTAAAQQQVGTPVSSESALLPGDLVFFGDPAYHVGMYVGNGDMIAAPTTGQDVQIQAIFSGFSGGRRLVG